MPFAAWRSTTTREIDTTGSPAFETRVDTDTRATHGFFPQVGVYVHLRL